MENRNAEYFMKLLKIRITKEIYGEVILIS